MNPVFGIDLGTTNSVIAWVRDGTPEVLSVDGVSIVPSVVGLDASGALVCGSAARNQLAAYPERTVASIKRRMGTAQTVRLGDRELSPPEVSALILKDLARRGEVATGVPVRRVVITVPAFFQDAQRAATRRAGELAGLEVVRLVNEPTAAALAFEGGNADRERTVLVYDLGGGTFDCSIVTTDGELVEVLASHGDVLLGGDDFDRLLAEHLLRGLDAGLLDEPATRYRLLQAAEAAKCRLTEDVVVKVREEFLKQGPPPVHLDAEVERDDFERLIAPLLERTLDSVHRALEVAGRSLNQIDDVLLVGGQTRTPLVAERLRALLGKPPRRDLHPDLCVALGAAIAGARHSGAKTERVLVDVTPYSFGTSYLGELDGEESPHCYKVVIERGSPLPVTRSETFYTVAPFQKAIDAQIFQGESGDARDNILIGRFMVDDLTPMPTPNAVVFRMQLGLDGILHVEVQERSTGKTRRVRIDGATAPPTAEQLAASKSRVEELWGDDADDEAGAAPAAVEDWSSELRMLIARARSLMTGLAEEDQQEIEALIADAEDALDRADPQAGADVHRELEDLVHYAEEG